MTDQVATGWNIDAENFQAIKEVCRAKVPHAFMAAAIPDEVRPDVKPNPHQLENQSSMGSCQGHAIASCVEQLYTIATGGERRQLSNIFAYLATQKIDGLLGSDRGSTISGGVKLAASNGICPLENAPYPHPVRYPSSRDQQRILSQANYQAGEPFKIRSHVGIKSYEQAKQWVGGGGVISLGITWPPQTRKVNGRATIMGASSRGGGHAIAILGYKKNGNLIIANSHNYWMDCTPQAFEQLLRQRYTVAIGLSDLANPVPRDLSALKKFWSQKSQHKKDLWLWT